MPRIADALERESRTVDLEQGDFERLLDRRERKQRNRRIRAGAVAVIVALATAAAPRPLDRMGARPGDPAEAARSRRGPPRGDGPGRPGSRQRRAAHDRRCRVAPVRRRRVHHRRRMVTSTAVGRVPSRPGSQAGELWVADTVGGAPRQVATDVGWSPWVWSPTEDQLVFVLGRDVTLFDAATGRETDLGTDGRCQGQRGLRGARPGVVAGRDPDRLRRGPEGSVYSIDVESGEHTLLVRRPAGTASVKDIDWSPDGAHLAITYGASYIATRRPSYKAACTSRTRMGPTSASWTASTRDCGRSGIPA